MGNKFKGGTLRNKKDLNIFSLVSLMLLAIIVGVTLAFFFNSDFATKLLGISGKVDIVAVGKGDLYNSIEDSVSSSNLEIQLDNGHTTLIPGMPVSIDVNCKVKRSTTKPLLRAWLNLYLYDVETYEKINEWGEESEMMIDINNQLDSIITSDDKWLLHSDGFYYYVETIDTTESGNSLLKQIDATQSDVIVPFIDQSIEFPKSVDSSYSGYGLKVRVTFQAIQNYIPDETGEKLPNTITNSYKIFNGFADIYEATPVSLFNVVEVNGVVTLMAKEGAVYPSNVYLPTKTADGKTITKIGNGIFKNNTNIKNVYVPSTYTLIDESAFHTSSVMVVDASDSNITRINSYAFMRSNLTTIILPDTIESIWYQAFMYCNNLTSIHLPANVSVIAGQWIANCPNMREITVDENNENFYDIDGKSLVKQDGTLLYVVPKYEDSVYTVDDRITKIEGGAFNNCSNITTLNLNKNVSSLVISGYINYVNLGENTNFENLIDEYGNKFLIKKEGTEAIICTLASSATALTVPDVITKLTATPRPSDLIKKITMVTYGTGLTSLTNMNFSPATYAVKSGNTTYKTITGMEIVSYDGKIMYKYASGNSATTYTIPSGVERVATGFNSTLQTLIMTTDVLTVDAGITGYMYQLINLTLSGSIGGGNGYYSFRLKYVTLNDNVTNIGDSFLRLCKALEWVEFKGTTPPTLNASGLFAGTNSTFVIYVPDSAVNTYKAVDALSAYVDRIKPVSERP